MLVSEASDEYLAAICNRMKKEDSKLFQVFLDRHPEIRVRYEAYSLTQIAKSDTMRMLTANAE